VNWLKRNLSRELALVVASQTTSSTSPDEVHALAMFGPYKQKQIIFVHENATLPYYAPKR
jgi:hypothetical protein